MDADALRMLADLGLDRRETLSAPTRDDKSHGYRADAHEEAAVRAKADAHRAQHRRNDNSSAEDSDAAVLRAWKTESNFEKDDAAAKLENHMHGQGHRAGLTRQHNKYDERREAFEARFGEEKALYRLECGGNFDDNDGPFPSRSSGREHPRNTVGLAASTPRTFADDRLPQGRGRATKPSPQQSQASGHKRAPSPRSFGTVRFNPPTRSNAKPASEERGIISPRKQVAAAIRAAAAQRSLEGTAAKGIAPSALSLRSASSRDAQTTPAPDAMSKRVSVQVSFNQALFCAAHTGEECNRLLAKYPNALPYLEVARKKLITEAIDLAKDSNESEVTRYVQGHQERKWIVEAAAKARSLVEQGDDTKIEAHCGVHPHEATIVQAAKAVFKPVIRKDSAAVVDVKAAAHDKQAAASSAVQSPMNISRVSGAVEETAPDICRSDSARSAGIGSSLPPCPREGSLVVTFIDVGGNLLGAHQVAIQAPVQANISITSRASRFNPRELINCIDEMARNMVDRTSGLEGVRLADDGLWVEEEL